jgi:hypothetical protein
VKELSSSLILSLSLQDTPATSAVYSNQDFNFQKDEFGDFIFSFSHLETKYISVEG